MIKVQFHTSHKRGCLSLPLVCGEVEVCLAKRLCHSDTKFSWEEKLVKKYFGNWANNRTAFPCLHMAWHYLATESYWLQFEVEGTAEQSAHTLLPETKDVPLWQTHDALSLNLSTIRCHQVRAHCWYFTFWRFKKLLRECLTNQFGICSISNILIICLNFTLDIRPDKILK